MFAQVYMLSGRKGTPSFENAFSRTNAYQLGMEYLEGVARNNVVAQTSEKNVVQEAFSKSTSR